MQQDAESHSRSCEPCLNLNTRPEVPELYPVLMTCHMELVRMDYLTTGPGRGDKDFSILVITDQFTDYTHYGIPKNIIQTRARTLRVSWYKSCVNWDRSEGYLSFFVTLRPMTSMNISTKH